MATAHKSRVLDMTQGDPFRLVLQFSMPLFCSNLLQQLYNLTDTALAGHLLGSAALAEIGATAALYGLIMNFAFGMNNGLALTVSRYFGAGDEKGMRRAVGWMVTLSVGTSLVLTATSLLARTALYAGCDVVAGEVHGMAQRGGVVESVCLLGGWRLTSAKLTSCSALSLWKPCAACPISEATALFSRALTPCLPWE